MQVPLATWIAVPVLGGVIGYVTNWLAVKMIFRPIRPVRVLGIRVQGLIGRRQKDLADRIGRVVGDHLVQHADIVESFAKVDIERLLGDVIDSGLQPKIDELRSLPLIGGFLTADRVRDLRASLLRSILARKDVILEKLEEAVEQGLDVQTLVREKVAAFQVERLEEMVLDVARRELRAIEILGAVLGLLIGLGQVAVIALLAP